MEDETTVRGIARLGANVFAGLSLSIAILFGLVRRGILSADDAKDIIGRAKTLAIEAVRGAESSDAVMVEIEKISESLLKHPTLTGEPEL